jgi:ketosteroid isomerase-like protein
MPNGDDNRKLFEAADKAWRNRKQGELRTFLDKDIEWHQYSPSTPNPHKGADKVLEYLDFAGPRRQGRPGGFEAKLKKVLSDDHGVAALYSITAADGRPLGETSVFIEIQDGRFTRVRQFFEHPEGP